jgi:hypothetical protein
VVGCRRGCLPAMDLLSILSKKIVLGRCVAGWSQGRLGCVWNGLHKGWWAEGTRLGRQGGRAGLEMSQAVIYGWEVGYEELDRSEDCLSGRTRSLFRDGEDLCKGPVDDKCS